MRGNGPFAQQIKDTIQLARQQYFANKINPDYNISDFVRAPKGQYSLF